MEGVLEAIQIWVKGTSLSYLMTHYQWAWPISECLHFMGLCLLIGTVGVFDLRMIGFLKRIPLGKLHRLIPWGIFGYGINVVTGLSFLSGRPDQYIHNPAFQIKILFMLVAGLNVAVFYLTMYRRVALMGSEQRAPLGARLAGAISLACWIGIIVCGRYLTFYRPPNFFWCPWC
jgi:hypothetical protein